MTTLVCSFREGALSGTEMLTYQHLPFLAPLSLKLLGNLLYSDPLSVVCTMIINIQNVYDYWTDSRTDNDFQTTSPQQ